MDLSHYPLPDWRRSPGTLVKDGDSQLPPVAFSEDAHAAGLDFVYHNGQDPQLGTRLVETIGGGGIGVLDFDLDGWPDMYFTQGGPWPPDPGQRRYASRLFHNRGDGTFQDATSQAASGRLRLWSRRGRGRLR